MGAEKHVTSVFVHGSPGATVSVRRTATTMQSARPATPEETCTELVPLVPLYTERGTGICYPPAGVRVYEGSPSPPENYVDACATACRNQKSPESDDQPATWASSGAATGFSVLPSSDDQKGRCYCNHMTWATCPAQTATFSLYTFYDFTAHHTYDCTGAKGRYVVVQSANGIDEVSVCSEGAVKSAKDLISSDVRRDGHWQVPGPTGTPYAALYIAAHHHAGRTIAQEENEILASGYVAGVAIVLTSDHYGCPEQTFERDPTTNANGWKGDTNSLTLCGSTIYCRSLGYYSCSPGSYFSFFAATHPSLSYVAAVTNPLTSSNVFSWWSGVRPLETVGKKVLLVLLGTPVHYVEIDPSGDFSVATSSPAFSEVDVPWHNIGSDFCSSASLTSGSLSTLQSCKEQCEGTVYCNYISYHADAKWCMTHPTCETRTANSGYNAYGFTPPSIYYVGVASHDVYEDDSKTLHNCVSPTFMFTFLKGNTFCDFSVGANGKAFFAGQYENPSGTPVMEADGLAICAQRALQRGQSPFISYRAATGYCYIYDKAITDCDKTFEDYDLYLVTPLLLATELQAKGVAACPSETKLTFAECKRNAVAYGFTWRGELALAQVGCTVRLDNSDVWYNSGTSGPNDVNHAPVCAATARSAAWDLCPRGTFQDEVGKTICKTCPSGHVQAGQGRTSCETCDVTSSNQDRPCSSLGECTQDLQPLSLGWRLGPPGGICSDTCVNGATYHGERQKQLNSFAAFKYVMEMLDIFDVGVELANPGSGRNYAGSPFLFEGGGFYNAYWYDVDGGGSGSTWLVGNEGGLNPAHQPMCCCVPEGPAGVLNDEHQGTIFNDGTNLPTVTAFHEKLCPLPVTMVNRGPNPTTNNYLPLARCEGDCDSDAHCADDLICYLRTTDEAVPGCLTGGSGDVSTYDYCVDCSSLLVRL